MSQRKAPLAIFDSAEYLNDQKPATHLDKIQIQDFEVARMFLSHYSGNDGTFRSYRREVEKILQWTWLIAEKTLPALKREDIEKFIKFCQKPPKSWIGFKISPRFIDKEGLRIPNTEWRPFIVKQSKLAKKQGHSLSKDHFALSDHAIKGMIQNLGSFFQFAVLEEYLVSNPMMLLRQKSRFLKKQQGPRKIRRLSSLQWQSVISFAQQLAENNPKQHERTLFMITALYAMYLRISELVASDRWIPTMNDFHRDSKERWWFTTVGKGNKERDIAVSNQMMKALKRWRLHLGLSALPSPADNTPLIPKLIGKGPLSNTFTARRIIQVCFDGAAEQLENEGFIEEAATLKEATVHWLRHTGISEDVKHRPREHVRDDAGHGSSAITDLYIDIELDARHKSAKQKKVEH